jgi:hypothetical protein
LGLDLLFSMSGVDTTTGTAVMMREFGAGLVHATSLNQMIRFRMILLAAYYNSLCRINISHHLWVVESQFCSLFSVSFATTTSLPPWQLNVNGIAKVMGLQVLVSRQHSEMAIPALCLRSVEIRQTLIFRSVRFVNRSLKMGKIQKSSSSEHLFLL